MKNNINNIILILFISLVTSCSQKEPAGVDYLGKNYYGRDNQINKAKNKNYIIVAKGDTLIKIARRYNINISKLAANNNIDPNYKVKLGQKLIINKSNNDIAIIKPKETSIENSYNPYDKVKIKQLDPPSLKIEPQKEESLGQKLFSVEKPIKEEKQIEVVHKNSKYIWPVRGKITVGFGLAANGTKNDGINIEAAQGSNVKAIADGVVAYSGNGLKGYGNLIIIKHNDSILSAYAHMDDLILSKEDKVTQGQIIGHVGSTGDVSTPQLHFALRVDKKPTNPLSLLP